jgi:hypothetical protein
MQLGVVQYELKNRTPEWVPPMIKGNPYRVVLFADPLTLLAPGVIKGKLLTEFFSRPYFAGS